MDFLEFNESDNINGNGESGKFSRTDFFKDIFSMIIPGQEETAPIPPPPPSHTSIGLFLDISPAEKDVSLKEKEKVRSVALKEKYETPFARDEDDSNKNPFQYLELDRSLEKAETKQKNWIPCPNCGALNPKGNEFCASCQMELVTFRQLDLEEKKVKVVLKFSNKKKYKFCPSCGGANPIDAQFCGDCMALLE